MVKKPKGNCSSRVTNTAAAVSNLEAAVTLSVGSEIFSDIQKGGGRALTQCIRSLMRAKPVVTSQREPSREEQMV